MYFLQVGWPGWASTGAGALNQLLVGVGGQITASATAWLGILLFLICVVVLAVGQKVERTLELAQWFMIAWIIGFLLVADLFLVPLSKWPALIGGYFGFNAATGSFLFIPPGADFLLLGAFAAYSGAGGCINATISNWMRDKGFGMGSVVGFIPGAVGGKLVKLSHTGIVFEPKGDNMRKWNIWWKYAGADQYGLWLIGAFLGMGLPGLMAFNFIKAGTDIRGLGVAAALANEVYKVGGIFLWALTLLCGVWILFSTQLGIIDGFVRGCTDMIWTGSKFAREKIGDVRVVYYGLLALMTVWGVGLMALPLLGVQITGIDFIQQGANWAGVNFVFLAVLTIIVNRKFLPAEVKPAVWREATVVLCGIFFAFFALAWLFTSASGLAQIPMVVIYFGIFLVWGVLAYFLRKK
jgi:hypothetical protein